MDNMKKIKLPTKIDGKLIFPFEMKDFSQDEEYFYFEGYLSTFGNEDRGGDIVEKGAFIESLKEHIPSLLWMHKSDQPLGVFDEMREDGVGLWVKGRMPLEDKFVRDRIIPQMKIGSIKSMSIGYSIWGKDGATYAKDVRHLNKLFLWEGSLVTIPMNDMANLKTKAAMPFSEEMPIAPRSMPWDELAALGRVREWAGTEDDGLQDPEVQEKYRQAFLWYDQEDQDVFGSYKLMIADIVEGVLTVVPRAVFAAAGRLKGARGGVWFWFEEDRPSVMRTVEKYYEKMDLSSPFGKSFRIDDFKAHDAPALEDLFRSGASMSRKSAMILISALKSEFLRQDEAKSQRDVDEEGETEGLDTLLKSIKEINKIAGGI